MKLKKFKLNSYGKEFTVVLQKTTYRNNGRLAIQMLYEEEKDLWFPFANLTVNIDSVLTGPKETNAFIDMNNCPWALDFILNNNLGKETGHMGSSGYCVDFYPEIEFDLTKF